MLSEVSWTQKDKSYMVLLTCAIKKNLKTIDQTVYQQLPQAGWGGNRKQMKSTE